MNKKGDFYITYEMVLSIARIFVIIIFALAMSSLIGSQAKKEVTSWDLESDEFFNSLISCSTTNYKLDEVKIKTSEKCLKTSEYGAEINFKNEKIVFNKEKFGNLFSLCNTKSIYCKDFSFFDGVNELKANVLVMKNG
ncbi:hypothetical protein HY498_00190 [Candidatus Woesearchaeota archaeon]|nr:hypothetical protein [Candidatus Woesearchaeota archaeon]